MQGKLGNQSRSGMKWWGSAGAYDAGEVVFLWWIGLKSIHFWSDFRWTVTWSNLVFTCAPTFNQNSCFPAAWQAQMDEIIILILVFIDFRVVDNIQFFWSFWEKKLGCSPLIWSRCMFSWRKDQCAFILENVQEEHTLIMAEAVSLFTRHNFTLGRIGKKEYSKNWCLF